MFPLSIEASVKRSFHHLVNCHSSFFLFASTSALVFHLHLKQHSPPNNLVICPFIKPYRRSVTQVVMWPPSTRIAFSPICTFQYDPNLKPVLPLPLILFVYCRVMCVCLCVNSASFRVDVPVSPAWWTPNAFMRTMDSSPHCSHVPLGGSSCDPRPCAVGRNGRHREYVSADRRNEHFNRRTVVSVFRDFWEIACSHLFHCVSSLHLRLIDVY